MQSAIESTSDTELKNRLQNKYTATAVKLKEKEQFYKKYCSDNKLRTQNERLQIANWSHSQAMKAVQAEKKKLTSGSNGGNIRASGIGNSPKTGHHYELIGKIDYSDTKAVAQALKCFEEENRNSKIEKCIVITTNGEKYIVYGDKWTVNTDLLGDKMKGSINEHNHVTGESQYSFSYEDLKSSIADGSKMSMAFDEKHRYFMQFSGKEITEEELYNAFEEAKNEVNEINYNYQHVGGTEYIADDDIIHEIVKRTCERLGIIYGRTKK